jgi:putative ABC transport system permease protein
MSLLSRFVNVFRRRVDEDLDEELRFHVEEKARRLMTEGYSANDAAREARRVLGNALVLRERSRDVKVLVWLDALLGDARYALRVLRRDFVVTGAAIASLALAMGAAIAAFVLIDALVLRPLPVREPQRLIYLAYPNIEAPPEKGTSNERTSFSYPALERLRQGAGGIVALFGLSYQAGPRDFMLAGPGTAVEKAYAQYVSGELFGALGLVPATGRLLGASDESLTRPNFVAVLSHDFWTSRFGRDPKIVGRWLTLRREQFRIVGVAPPGFTGLEPGIRTGLWMPLTTYEREALTSGGNQWFRIIGRLAPGTSAAAVRARLQPAYRHFLEDRVKEAARGAPKELIARFLSTPLVVHPAANGPSDLRITFERPLWILSGVVALVLLIASSNVANLLIARAAAREREMALRMSIGAGRARLIQQLLTESVILSAIACALGVLFAALAAPAIVRMLSPSDLPVYLELSPGWRLIGFLATVVTATSLLFGLTPAMRASGATPIVALKTLGSRVAGRIGLLRPLVAAQVAFSLAVLFVAGLLVTSFARLTTMDTGFTKSGITLLKIWSDELGDRERANLASVHALVRPALDRVRALPSIQAAAFSFWGLFEGSAWSSIIRLPGRQTDPREVYYLEVSPGFMQTMGIRLVAGRDFTDRDMEHRVAAPDDPAPVLVNEAFVARYFPGERPVGRRFERLRGKNPAVGQDIVGIVANAKYRDLRESSLPVVYLPMTGLNGKTLEVRSEASPEALASVIRTELARIDPDVKIVQVMEQATLIDNTLLRERLLALLSGFFGLVSLALAVIGLYGVLSYSVVQRTPEIGIRRALGARTPAVVRAVLADILSVTALGLAIGLTGGLSLARFVRSLLYEVTPYDAVSIALPVAILLVAAIAAAILPLRRALRVDPIVALRYE